MKMLLRLSLAILLFTGSKSLLAASIPHNGPTTDKGNKTAITAQPSHEQNAAVEENKKFTLVTYYFIDNSGLGITDPTNWSTTGTCSDGNVNLCSITFDTNDFPLVSGKPSSTLLSGVNSNWTSVKPNTSGDITVSGHTVHVVLKP